MNLSFLSVFLSMIFYWIQLFFQGKTKFLGQLTMVFANLSLFCLLVFRWWASGHFPLSNLYESLIFLSWALTTIHLILEKVIDIPFLGAITSPSALLTDAFATFSLPSDMQEASPLVPALQSNWLMMHVTVMIISYAALIFGSLLSIAFLILSADNSFDENAKELTSSFSFVNNVPPFVFQKEKQSAFSEKNLSKQIQNNLVLASNSLSIDDAQTFPPSEERCSTKEYVLTNSEETTTKFTSLKNASKIRSNKIKKIQFIQTLDHLSYRVLGLGFPFLTIGILSGAVWANEAWGSYWSWDPKETWALLTWLVFAIYLHTRFSKGWQGKKPAIIASFGFFVVWICYLGVNLMGEGLHSYGWIHS